MNTTDKHSRFFTDPRYFEPFFVGLFEGDGCMYLVRKANNGCFARLTIGLKKNKQNEHLLQGVKNYFGGNVHTINQDNRQRITWSASSQKTVNNLLRVFVKYPFLTTRKTCQFNHIKQCLLANDWAYHLNTRDSKFDSQIQGLKHTNFVIPKQSHFGPWLSGFSEAEGHFSAKPRKVLYNIGQNNDWFLIDAIRQYFHSKHTICSNPGSKQHVYYRIDIGGVPALVNIVDHFNSYPLLGYKQISYAAFYIEAARLIAKAKSKSKQPVS